MGEEEEEEEEEDDDDAAAIPHRHTAAKPDYVTHCFHTFQGKVHLRSGLLYIVVTTCPLKLLLSLVRTPNLVIASAGTVDW